MLLYSGRYSPLCSTWLDLAGLCSARLGLTWLGLIGSAQHWLDSAWISSAWLCLTRLGPDFTKSSPVWLEHSITICCFCVKVALQQNSHYSYRIPKCSLCLTPLCKWKVCKNVLTTTWKLKSEQLIASITKNGIGWNLYSKQLKWYVVELNVLLCYLIRQNITANILHTFNKIMSIVLTGIHCWWLGTHCSFIGVPYRHQYRNAVTLSIDISKPILKHSLIFNLSSKEHIS